MSILLYGLYCLNFLCSEVTYHFLCRIGHPLHLRAQSKLQMVFSFGTTAKKLNIPSSKKITVITGMILLLTPICGNNCLPQAHLLD